LPKGRRGIPVEGVFCAISYAAFMPGFIRPPLD
jgi:hypothetical protein